MLKLQYDSVQRKGWHVLQYLDSKKTLKEATTKSIESEEPYNAFLVSSAFFDAPISRLFLSENLIFSVCLGGLSL